MTILLFSPLIFFGLYLLAILDLRYERGRERDLIRLVISGILPIGLFFVTLWIAGTPDQFIWASSFSAVLTLVAYLGCGFDLIVFRKEKSAQTLPSIALIFWLFSLVVYAFLFLKLVFGL